MKKLLVVIVIALIALIGFGMIGPFNSMKKLDIEADGKWAEVETQYQRRFDLVENLVKTVNASADFEKETLVQVTEARSALKNADGGKNLDAINSGKSGGLMAVGGMRGMMMGYMEKYPDIKSTEAFRDLMGQLEGTENRIAKARGDFNEEVKTYNQKVGTFPNNMMAGMFGFAERDYFTSTNGAEKGIDVGGRKFGE